MNTIEEWKKDFKEYVNGLSLFRDDYKGIMEYIEEVPTVEITEKQAILLLINSGWLVNHDKELREKWKRPQGEWINEYYDDGWFHTCNRCKEELKATGEDNFCPNCGADMRKGGEKE